MDQLEKKLMETTVLIIDDQKFIRNILGDMLRSMGVRQLYLAEDGTDAIKQFRAWLPDLIITDWKMPNMTGIEFTKWVRMSDESPNPEIPIVMLTANNLQEHITQARDAGVSELISKPMVPQSIVARLNAALFQPRKFVNAANYRGPDRRRRQSAAYKGPMRRLTDPVRVNNKTPEEQLIVDAICSVTQKMMQTAKSLDVTDRAQVLSVYHQAKETEELALQADDLNLEQASKSLTQYIESMGASGLMENKVVDMHLQALMSLVHLPDSDETKKAAVVKSLLALVRKKFNETQNAPEISAGN